MKPKQDLNIINNGDVQWKSTNEYKRKVDEIKKEVNDKYSFILLNEKNWMKRLFIEIRLWIETRKRIQELSSLKNLHLVNELH